MIAFLFAYLSTGATTLVLNAPSLDAFEDRRLRRWAAVYLLLLWPFYAVIELLFAYGLVKPRGEDP